MEALFSTESFAPQERFERWSEAFVQASGWPFPADPLDPARFQAKVTGALVGATPLLAQRASPYRLRFGKREISATQDRPTALLLLCQAGELLIEVNGERLRLRPGEMLLLDLAQPIVCHTLGESQTLKIPIDRGRIGPFRGPPLARHWRPGEGLMPLVTAYVDALTRLPREELARHGALLSEQLHALVGSALLQDSPEPQALEPHSLAAARLVWIERWLDDHYARANLTAEQAAQAAGISVRYLHRLFETRGTTFSASLQSRRLAAAKAALENPADTRTLTVIAHDCGFCDGAHFSRVFRVAFGMAPSDYRIQALMKEQR